MAYSATEHALFSLEKMVAADVTLPPVNTSVVGGIGGMGKGALSGLGGYMTLGMGKRAKPLLLKLQDGEVLIPRESRCPSKSFVFSNLMPFSRTRYWCILERSRDFQSF